MWSSRRSEHRSPPQARLQPCVPTVLFANGQGRGQTMQVGADETGVCHQQNDHFGFGQMIGWKWQSQCCLACYSVQPKAPVELHALGRICSCQSPGVLGARPYWGPEVKRQTQVLSVDPAPALGCEVK